MASSLTFCGLFAVALYGLLLNVQLTEATESCDGDVCYKSEHRDVSLTWDQARDHCRSTYGGDLASLKDEKEMRLIWGLVYRKFNRGWHWIGLHEEGGEFKWSDGSPVSYTNWAQGEPSDKQGMTKCVALSTGYDESTVWKTFNCETAKWFFCKYKKGAAPLPPVLPPLATCGSNSHPYMPTWYLYEGYCYATSVSKYTDTKKTWKAAREQCQTDGGELVSIANRQEQDFVSGLLGRTRIYHPAGVNEIIPGAWIGLNNIEGNGFGWSDGSSVSATYWDKGQPDEGSECTAMESLNGFWATEGCAASRHYVCKKVHKPE